MPKLEIKKKGPSNYNSSESDLIDFQNVFVAKETDSIDVINQNLALGL